MGEDFAEAVIRRLERIEKLILDQKAAREWHTTEEFARLVGKAEFTVREWCRHGRIHARKRMSGRGGSCSWAVSNDEVLRYQKEGLLPARRP